MLAFSPRFKLLNPLNEHLSSGTAPSAELLATWNKREGELIAAHVNSVPPVAFPPEPIGAYVGQKLPEDVMKKVAEEGARTIPGREHGGNCDVSHSSVMSVLLSYTRPRSKIYRGAAP